MRFVQSIEDFPLPFFCVMAQAEERKDLGYPGVSEGDVSASGSTAFVPDTGGRPTGSGILYAANEIPSLPFPQYEGASYEVVVPDTLDLVQRCALAIHALHEGDKITGCVNSAAVD